MNNDRLSTEMFPGVVYALLAGFLGAVASSSAKLSLGADYLKGVCETGLKNWRGEEWIFQLDNESAPCDWVCNMIADVSVEVLGFFLLFS